MQMCFAIYKVWERKCKCVLPFTKCGSENAIVFCYLQSVGAKMQLYFAIYRVWERKCKCVLLFTECGNKSSNAFLCIQSCYSSLSMMDSCLASRPCFNGFYRKFAQKKVGGYRFLSGKAPEISGDREVIGTSCQ